MTKPITGQTNPAVELPPLRIGKDEMNLAEFPLTRLGTRDQREILHYEGWVMDERKRPYRQVWTVRGASGLGLPNEFGDRVILALIALTFKQNPLRPRVNFSRYQLLRFMGLTNLGRKDYRQLEKTLMQMVGMTIESERAFFDKSSDRRLVSKKAFHLLSKLWIRKQEADGFEPEEEAGEGSNGYVVWSQEFWGNLQSGYIKNIDLGFYYGLPTPLARRLYRFLDKRMYHRESYEIDIFDLTDRLGQQRYAKPSEAFRKLKPSLETLIESHYLKSADLVKHDRFTRVRFVRQNARAFEQHLAKQKAQQAAVDGLHTQFATSAELTGVWARVLEMVSGQLSATQQAVLAESQLLAVAGTHAVVLVPSRFAGERLRTQTDVTQFLCSALTDAGGQAVDTLDYMDIETAQKQGA